MLITKTALTVIAKSMPKSATARFDKDNQSHSILFFFFFLIEKILIWMCKKESKYTEKE